MSRKLKSQKPSDAPDTSAFCLFHECRDCICINPVLTESDLIARLTHWIRLNDILSKFAPDEERRRRAAENTRFQTRLDKLKEKSL